MEVTTVILFRASWQFWTPNLGSNMPAFVKWLVWPKFYLRNGWLRKKAVTWFFWYLTQATFTWPNLIQPSPLGHYACARAPVPPTLSFKWAKTLQFRAKGEASVQLVTLFIFPSNFSVNWRQLMPNIFSKIRNEIILRNPALIPIHESVGFRLSTFLTPQKFELKKGGYLRFLGQMLKPKSFGANTFWSRIDLKLIWSKHQRAQLFKDKINFLGWNFFFVGGGGGENFLNRQFFWTDNFLEPTILLTHNFFNPHFS